MLYYIRFNFLLLAIVFFGIAGKAQDTTIEKNPPVSSNKDIIVKYGIASYYANKFEGRKTYTDKIYNGKLLTAACNVLPMGTWVKVTNLKNRKTVVVEINDKLAKWNKRLIDLTYRAAKDLGYVGQGITRVKVEVLGDIKHHKTHRSLHKKKSNPKIKKSKAKKTSKKHHRQVKKHRKK